MSDGMPNAFADIFREPDPSTCSILVKTTLHSDPPLVLFHMARELGKPFVYGLNYINVRDSPRKLRRWYPILSRLVRPEALDESWRKIPPRGKVRRNRLTSLEEWVSTGKEGEAGFTRFTGTDNEEFEPGPQQLAMRQPEVGEWEPPPQKPPDTQPERASILPELDTLYSFVERVPQVPALIFIDSIDALAVHYGIKPIEIAATLVSDLVDGGVANLILVTEALESVVLDSLVDGIVQLLPQDNPRCLEWHLIVDRLPNGRRVSETYTLRIEAERIRSSPSQDEFVDLLTRGGSFFRSGLPKTLLESLGGPAFMSRHPPATSEENAP